MDDVYLSKLEKISRSIKRVNPLGSILERDVLNELLLVDDLLDIKTEQKKSLKRKYLAWCLKNHPDKAEYVDEDSIYIYKGYGDAFLRYSDADYDRVWMYMGYSSVTFNNINLLVLNVSDISRLVRDCDVLWEIAQSCTNIPTENLKIIEELKSDLLFVKMYINVKEQGHCTKHADNLNNTELVKDCAQCQEETHEISTDCNDDLSSVTSQNSMDENEIIEIDESESDEDESPHVTLKNKLNTLPLKSLISIVRSKRIDTSQIIEKSELIDIIIQQNLYDTEAVRIKNHKRRQNPSKIFIPHSTWDICERQYVNQLPFEIDGLKCYILKFVAADRMKSSRDGRSWTWVTSSRKGFLGVRRTGTCNGGFLCENSNCGFYSAYGKRNVYHFQKKEKMICKICDEEATITTR